MNPNKTRKLFRAYKGHRYLAGKQNIDFLLTFEEWLGIWVDSGHLEERGRYGPQYCMARKGDQGPYAVGNVTIKTNTENARELRHSPETRAKISRARNTPEWNAAVREAVAAPESKAKCSASSLRHWKDPEFRRKMIENHRKVQSVEERAKRAASVRRHWATLSPAARAERLKNFGNRRPKKPKP